jgi:hypothetical protein
VKRASRSAARRLRASAARVTIAALVALVALVAACGRSAGVAPVGPLGLEATSGDAGVAEVDPAYACTSSDDCVLACPVPEGCCGWLCGCEHAIRKDHVESFTRQYAKTCHRAPCPMATCPYVVVKGATCREGRCEAEITKGGP